MKKYVAMAVQDWGNFSQAETDDMKVTLNIQAPPGCWGYLPVYDSIESLRAVLPDTEYMEISI